MKAIICTKYGKPEVLEIREIDKPKPKDNEVLVKILSTAVNSGDVRVRGLIVDGFLRIVMRFVLGFNKPRKPVIGNVASGIIEEIGKDVKAFKVGDEVFLSTAFRFGTYADYIAFPENSTITHKPQKASFEDAVAIIFGGMTAKYFLEKAGISKLNKKVLIYGATGSVGCSAVEISKYYKANVTSVCSEQGAELSKKLGSDSIIIYTKEDFTKIDEKFDIIFDAVGKITKKQCSKLLKEDGKYITVGGLDVTKETKSQLEFLSSLYDKGYLHANIDKIYSFNEIREAHDYVEKGRKKGNVVIKVN
ncbi:MAG: NAD(P)-dependent alcohol dehydrogenase [Candidatus Sericytochromatia bacterium]